MLETWTISDISDIDQNLLLLLTMELALVTWLFDIGFDLASSCSSQFPLRCTYTHRRIYRAKNFPQKFLIEIANRLSF